MTAGLAIDLLELAKKHDAGKAWASATKDTIGHVLVVSKNNEGKPLKAILKRPDVKEAMVEPFVNAGVETIEACRQAWGDLPTADLNMVLKNVRKNTTAMPARVRQAMLEGDREEMPARLAKLAKDAQRRAEMAVEYLQKRAKTLQAIQGAGPGGTKTWDGPNAQCSTCQALHGTTIPVDQAFDHTAGGKGLGVFGTLIGPPRHPNCHCTLKVG